MVHTGRIIPFTEKELQAQRDWRQEKLKQYPGCESDFTIIDERDSQWRSWTVFVCTQCYGEMHVLTGHTSAISLDAVGGECEWIAP